MQIKGGCRIVLNRNVINFMGLYVGIFNKLYPENFSGTLKLIQSIKRK